MSSVNIGKQHPTVYKGLVKLDAEVKSALDLAGVDPLLVELVKIRVSQLNGCAFCLRMHTRDSLAKGEKADRSRLSRRGGRRSTSATRSVPRSPSPNRSPVSPFRNGAPGTTAPSQRTRCPRSPGSRS